LREFYIILVLPVTTSPDNDMSEQGRQIVDLSIPGLTEIWLKKEMDLNCQNEMPSHFYEFVENDSAKQEPSHTGKRPYECDIWEKHFVKSATLSCHKKNDSREKPFQCYICEKTFRQKANLFVHQRTHTGEKPFECDICKKCFTSSSDLSIHQRTHMGEKRFACDICKKRFISSSCLSIHQRTDY